jgi:hypothetical protein
MISLNDSLEKSIAELQLLAKFYQKHGYQQQAQDIYGYILNIQDRLEASESGSQESHQSNQSFSPPPVNNPYVHKPSKPC